MKITEPLTNNNPQGIITLDSVLKEIVERISGTVADIICKRASGEILIQFHEGKFQRSKATIVKHL